MLVRLIRMVVPPAGILEPPRDDWFERRRIEVVKLVPTIAPGLDESGILEDVEVLRNRLA
ncbi:hypothetical protein MCHIJ_11710 [Mycolicibacterium chitae]|nr:hypothetical protein MCHIJ_11710 [Mycolicibacterium chitae]